MSASMVTVIATALFVAIGPATETTMFDAIRDSECGEQDWRERQRLVDARECIVLIGGVFRNKDGDFEYTRPWMPEDGEPDLYELREPEWVPSDQSTAHRLNRQWMKLRL